MKVKRKIIEINEDLCDGCGLCVPSCAEGALQVVDGKAKLVSEIYCDGLGACLGECPTGALQVIEREAEDFDEQAVEEHLKSSAPEQKQVEETLPCGCPSTQLKSFGQHGPSHGVSEGTTGQRAASELSHWPVQIKLVPPTAPFLKGADLLVAADCTPVAYPNFHQDFLRGKVVMVGCPKFDDQQEYIEKFADIFKTADIKSVTVVVMEVPCCQGLPLILERGMELAGRKVPIERVIISARGELLSKSKLAA
ncbi:MAG: 4Fe-4S binding protein [Deltaproteobacteria bacterium]|nr:4Fe-4S binding protein [Deltaproteobacteria bacterium]MBW2138194.1 4Fe-4S binding protein [Deltaproteobacteria bacterium]